MKHMPPPSRFDAPPAPPAGPAPRPPTSTRPAEMWTDPEMTPIRRVRVEREKRRFGWARRLALLAIGLLTGLVGGLLLAEEGRRRAGPGMAAEGRPDPAATATEEARLAALREERLRLEAELASLAREAEARRRSLPGRKSEFPPEAGTGGETAPTRPPAQPVQGAGQPVQGAGQPATAAEAPARPGATRVFVHHRAGSAPAGQAAEETAQGIRASGMEVAGIRQTAFVPAARVVRYFHDQDATAAARLAGRLGNGWAIQDFRAFQPQPAPGTLEVWLPAN